MAKTIVFGNTKGGTGKSTLTVHVSTKLFNMGHRVACIDLDTNQFTTFRYIENRKNSGYGSFESYKIEDSDNSITDFQLLIQKLEKKMDFIIVDTPGNNTELSTLAHSHADLIVTPINDSFVDVDLIGSMKNDHLSLGTYSNMLWEAKRKAKGNIEWIVVRNRLSNLVSKNNEEIKKELSILSKKLNFTLSPGFYERTIFRELFKQGLTVFDMKKDGPNKMTMSHIMAKVEIQNLINLILKKTSLY